MDNKASIIFKILTSVVGLAVLIPAFVLLFQFAILGGNARSEIDSANTPLAIWLALGTLFGSVAYLIVLGVFVLKLDMNCRWCLYYLSGYAICVAAMVGYISSGDFTLQLKHSGLFVALSENILGLVYVAVPLLFVALLIFRTRVDQ